MIKIFKNTDVYRLEREVACWETANQGRYHMGTPSFACCDGCMYVMYPYEAVASHYH